MKWVRQNARFPRSRSNRKGLRWRLAELEARLMLAGDAAPAVAACVAEAPGQDSGSVAEACGEHQVVSSVAAEHLVILDSAIAGDSAWAEIAPDGAVLAVLSSEGDPIAEISKILSQHTGLRSVHLFCHGQDGVLHLGGTQVTEQIVTERATQLQHWGGAFASGGDLLIYGCDVAAGSKGVQLISTLADRIGVDVAASTDRTGSSRVGGDWDLELTIGSVEYAQVLRRDQLENYQGYLGIEIWAAGQIGEEVMELQIGNQVVTSWLLENTSATQNQFGVFTYNQDGVAPDDIRINFVNDYFDEATGIDRNLYVDRIVVDGVTYEAEDPSVFSSGVYVESAGGLTSGYLQTEIIHSFGYFQFAGPALSTGTTIDSFEGMNLNGAASYDGSALQLTGTGVREAGSAFNSSAITIDESTSFQTSFAFRIGGGSGTTGADGMTFLLQNSAQGTDALGRSGGYLGYDTISNSLAIEFDTYRNRGDASANGIAVVLNGQTRNAIAESTAPFDLNSDQQYYAWVDYDGTTDQLSVYLSDTEIKPAVAVLETQVELDKVVGDAAFVGFSAGNFDQPNYHQVLAWNFTTDAPTLGSGPGAFVLASSEVTVGEGQGSITIEVQRVGGSSGPASVDFLTISDSAVAGQDFIEAVGRLTFEDGETSKSVRIDLINDSETESLEQFEFRIQNPSNAGLQPTQSTRINIADDDLGLPDFASFASASGLKTNGSASIVGNELVLTDLNKRQAGSAFFEAPLAIEGSTSFQSAFSFSIGQGSGTSGADGLTFILQNSDAGTAALGRAGGFLGYDSISKSLAIEFDTFRNPGDSGDNTIAVVLNGNTRNPIAEVTAPSDLNNGAPYFAWVDYDGDTNTLAVFLSQTSNKPAEAVLTTQVDLNQVLDGSAIAGFTAGNYDRPNRHAVSSWSLVLDSATAPSPGPGPGSFSLVTSQVTAVEDQGEIRFEVRRVGGSLGDASIDFFTVGGTAIEDEDFINQSGTLFFADGETSKFITVQLVDDGLEELTEQFSVRIDNPIGASLLAPRTSLVTVLDDESVLPRYSSFDSQAGMNLNGSAAFLDDQLELTGTDKRQAGSAFYQSPIAVNSSTSFQSSFSFTIGGGNGSAGADGLTFLLQNSPEATEALGRAGGYLGYDSISRSVAIEFDTFLNPGDSSANSIAVVINGDTRNAISQTPAFFDLNNGTEYHAWVDYNGDSDTLAVYLSDTNEKPFFALLKTQLKLDEVVGDAAYLGFSAGNYDQPNFHRIGSWNFSLDVPPEDPPLNPSGDIVEQDLITGLNQPLALAWSPDGRNLYIAEKGGVIKVARDGSTNPTVLIDISDQVNNIQDRGLIDFAIHPDFEENGYVYLLYTYDPPEVFDNIGNTFAGPDGRGNRAGRLMRVTADASTDFTSIVPGSEVILLGTNSTWENFNAFVDSTVRLSEPQAGFTPGTGYLRDFINSDSLSHTVGSLAFALDGSLFVSIGDGASFNQTDPRALRVQSLDSLSGKVLRIDPLTGQGLSDNPFFDGDPDSNRSKVYQLGLRNPWRLAARPGHRSITHWGYRAIQLRRNQLRCCWSQLWVAFL